jgi:hypothetical protein
VLGLSRVSFHGVNHPIAITDVPPAEATKASAGDREVSGQIVGRLVECWEASVRDGVPRLRLR